MRTCSTCQPSSQVVFWLRIGRMTSEANIQTSFALYICEFYLVDLVDFIWCLPNCRHFVQSANFRRVYGNFWPFFQEHICEVTHWCWRGRPGSQSSLLFVLKVFYQVEVRTLCRPVKFTDTILSHPCLYLGINDCFDCQGPDWYQAMVLYQLMHYFIQFMVTDSRQRLLRSPVGMVNNSLHIIHDIFNCNRIVALF